MIENLLYFLIKTVLCIVTLLLTWCMHIQKIILYQRPLKSKHMTCSLTNPTLLPAVQNIVLPVDNRLFLLHKGKVIPLQAWCGPESG